jgi:outer membrane protein TolC
MKKSFSIAGLFFVAALLLPTLAKAQNPASRTLSLEEALKLARKNNRNLAVERTKLQQAQLGIEQAWAAFFPTVAAQGRYTHNYKKFELGFAGVPLLVQPSNQFDFSINATQPLIAPAAYPALDAVKAGVRAAEAGFEVTETGVLMSVAHTFYMAAIADEMVAARQSNVEVAQATLANAEARFSAGAVTKVDVGRAELAVVRAQQMQRESITGRSRTYRALATLIQLSEPFVVKLTPEAPQQHDERELDLALSLRPEFRVIEATLQSSDEQARARKWMWLPTLSAFGNARKFNYDNFARDRHSWAIGAQLEWLIYDGGTRDYQRHLAGAQIAEAHARADVLRESVRDDLADGRQQLETKLQGVQAAERSVALAKETLEIVRVQYEAGNITQVDLLAAQDALVSAQEALAQSHFDAAAADLSLRRAAGTFPPQ